MSAPLVSPASSMRRSAAVTALAVLLAGHAGAKSTDVFRTKRFVEQISADPFAGAAGSEADTQVEPHIALDPNDPSIVVAVVQQGRFDTNGGSVDPGFATSQDGGRTWTAGNLPGLTVAVGGALPLVQPNGDVTVIYDLYGPPTGEVSQTSHDGGAHFESPVTIGTIESSGVPDMRTGAGLPAAAVDPVTARLYAVWTDGRFRSDGRDDIVLSASTDGGTSWGPLGAVNPSRPGDVVSHFTPAVAAHGGAVLVSYRTRRSDSRRVDMRYVASSDGGATFNRQRRLGRQIGRAGCRERG